MTWSNKSNVNSSSQNKIDGGKEPVESVEIPSMGGRAQARILQGNQHSTNMFNWNKAFKTHPLLWINWNVSKPLKASKCWSKFGISDQMKVLAELVGSILEYFKTHNIQWSICALETHSRPLNLSQMIKKWNVINASKDIMCLSKKRNCRIHLVPPSCEVKVLASVYVMGIWWGLSWNTSRKPTFNQHV